MAFKELDVAQISLNPFMKVRKEWMLVTAGDEHGYNTMTAAWGGFGYAWNHPVATCFLRPQRYTKEFVDAAGRFTLSFYGPEHRRALELLGSKSGREGDKVAEAGLTPLFVDGTVAFEQAALVFVCRTLYSDEVRPERPADPALDGDCYPAHDYHTVYVAAVEKALVRE